MLIPFVARPQKAFDRGGFIWCTPGDSYRIERFRIGSTVAAPDVIVRPSVVERVTPAERDSAVAVVEKFRQRWVGGNADPALIPTVKPAIEALMVDDRGRLWVKRPSSGKIGTRYDVWDRGRLIATVESPLRISPWIPAVVVGTTLYGVGIDDDGVQSVVVARIAP